MTLKDLLPLLEGELQTEGQDLSKPVLCGYSCDLLSWVMAHGRQGMAWITVQTHLNVVAVASLCEMSCVILPESIRMEAPSLAKAAGEGIAVVGSPLSAYALCARMAAAGIPA